MRQNWLTFFFNEKCVWKNVSLWPIYHGFKKIGESIVHFRTKYQLFRYIPLINTTQHEQVCHESNLVQLFALERVQIRSC